MNCKKNAILVILYNKEIESSITLGSFIKIDTIENSHIHVVNNGPSKIDFTPLNNLRLKGYSISYNEFIFNESLSKIYNDFVREFSEYEKFLFLDDDTILDNSPFSDSDDKYDVSFPIVRDFLTGKVKYPIIDDHVIITTNSYFTNSNDVRTVGSGLIIKQKVYKEFSSLGITLFDERYALYGVDFSFFRRARSLSERKLVFKYFVYGEVSHSLSSSNKIENWRYKERLIDNIITIIFYEKNFFIKVISLAKIVFKDIIKDKCNNLKVIIRTIIERKHPRS